MRHLGVIINEYVMHNVFIKFIDGIVTYGAVIVIINIFHNVLNTSSCILQYTFVLA